VFAVWHRHHSSPTARSQPSPPTFATGDTAPITSRKPADLDAFCDEILKRLMYLGEDEFTELLAVKMESLGLRRPITQDEFVGLLGSVRSVSATTAG